MTHKIRQSPPLAEPDDPAVVAACTAAKRSSSTATKRASPLQKMLFVRSSYGNRTHDSAVRGRRLSLLTNEPQCAFCDAIRIIQHPPAHCKHFLQISRSLSGFPGASHSPLQDWSDCLMISCPCRILCRIFLREPSVELCHLIDGTGQLV